MRVRYGLVALVGLVGLATLVMPSFTGASIPQSPPTFVAVTQEGRQFRSQVSIYSSTTGALVRRLANFSDAAFTNNGLAYAPDGSAVYFTLIPQQKTRRFSLRLMRLDVATRRQVFVAHGTQPAISNDGTQLAYGAARGGLAVRDLATGQTRTIRLGQLGTAANLLNAAISWLADGSDIAIVPAPTAWDLVGRPPKLHWCGTTQTRAVIVFVHVPAPPEAMTADCVHLAGRALDGSIALAGESASPACSLPPIPTATGRSSSGSLRPALPATCSRSQARSPSRSIPAGPTCCT